MSPPNQPSDVWRRVDTGAPEECWTWTGGLNACGYGTLRYRSRHWLAHRLVFLLATGQDPGDLRVLHRCDNPPCCNPAHLFLGTQAENVADCIAKGRFRSHRGENHNLARLTEAQVLEIRRLHVTGLRSAEIASRFGITTDHAWRITSGRIWKHILGEVAA